MGGQAPPVTVRRRVRSRPQVAGRPRSRQRDRRGAWMRSLGDPGPAGGLGGPPLPPPVWPRLLPTPAPSKRPRPEAAPLCWEERTVRSDAPSQSGVGERLVTSPLLSKTAVAPDTESSHRRADFHHCPNSRKKHSPFISFSLSVVPYNITFNKDCYNGR